MTLKAPKVTSLPLTGIWAGRDLVRGIFLREHDRTENLQVVEDEIDKNQLQLSPQNWLLLIEGHGQRHSVPLENRFVQTISEEHDLHVEDPVVNPFTSSIADQASIDRLSAATSVLVTDYLAPYPDRLLEIADGLVADDLIRIASEEVAEKFGVSATNVRRQFSNLSFSNPSKFKREIDIILQTRQGLINKSNKLSRKRLEEVLSLSDEGNILMMAGGAHEEVFKPSFNTQRIESQPANIMLNQFKQPSNLATTNKLQALSDTFLVRNLEMSAATPGSRDINEYFEHMDYIERINRVDGKIDSGTVTWTDFTGLMRERYNYHASVAWKSNVMLRALKKLAPKPLDGELYSECSLMRWALKDPVKEISRFFDWFGTDRDNFKRCAIDSAKMLRIIVGKIGSDLPDEVEIIRKLLLAPLSEVRDEGALAAYETRKHKWRYDQSAVWGIVRTRGYQAVPARKRKITLSVVSADPRFLFVKDKDDRFVIYKEKDPEIEKILVECAQESDPKIRARAFSVIGDYLTKHQIDDPSLDDVLVKGLENKDQGVLNAIYHRSRRGLIRNPKLLPLLKGAAHDTVLQNRSNALGALGFCLERERVNDPELKQISRNNLHDENEHVRVGASKVFGLAIYYEPVLEVQSSDVQSLLHIGSNDSSKSARSNATYGLAVITNRNIDLIPEDKTDQVEHLCAVNRDPEFASTYQLQSIAEALNKLVTVSGLEDAKLLLELEEHPSRTRVEQLIRKKDKYRDAIGPLLERIGALYQANLRLVANVEALTAENLALKDEAVVLRQKIRELAQELNRINASIKSNRVKKLLLSIGGTAFRNIVKGRGVAHAEFVKSIFIDSGWDLLVGSVM